MERLPRLSIAVGLATAGRPELLKFSIQVLQNQSRPPDAVLVCAPTDADVGMLPRDLEGLRVSLGPRGLTQQRNEILRHASQFDVIVFFDDDFLCDRSYIAVIEEVFAGHPDVVMSTGSLIADGILGPGIAVEDALAALDALSSTELRSGTLTDVYSGYGCNMAVRLEPVRANELSFDERLPLYGWLEDLDFSRQIAPFGRVVHLADAYGVHLGIKSGRQPGICLGYSQVANPIYLCRKGTCSWRTALGLMSRNMAANLVKSFWSEPHIDRFGRLSGNLKALYDLALRRLDPLRAPLLRA